MSDSPDTPSGFGMVTRFVCAGLARRGHRVSILGWQARAPYEWNGCRVYPTSFDPRGGDALFHYLVRHRPEAVIALGDVWWLPFFAAPHVRRQMELTDARWLLYFPIDGDTDDERLPRSWIELLREVDVPVAMSRYGQQVVNRCGITCEYIPHGVDLEVFSPPPDREQAKARVEASGKFLILSDSRNQPRKLLPRLLDVFAKFAAGRPDALLHLHTDPDDEFTQSGLYSYDVRADLRHLGIESQVRFSPGFTMKRGGGLALGELANYYQAADVHLLASSGEGFGLPTLQAAAAGAVPMAGAYSASRELVEGHGEAIAIQEWSHNEFGIRRALIHIDDAVEKLARYHQDRDLLQAQSAQSRRFALAYGWEEIIDRWDRLLKSVADSRSRGATVCSKPRAAERVVEQEISSVAGASIRVRMVERQSGSLEASIVADARRQSTDINIPAAPPPCEVSRVKVLRRLGRVCLAASDAPAFLALQRLFPLLSGWVPVWSYLPRPPDGELLEFLPIETVENASYELAQSVLVLNVCGSLPEEMLVDATAYGVPCIGTRRVAAQAALWPELAAEDGDSAVRVARALLTNAAQATRLSTQARLACRRAYAPNEEHFALLLRHQHAMQQFGVGAVVR